MAARRTTDFLARKLAQSGAEWISPLAETAAVAGEVGEIAIPARHVGYGVERGGAGEELGMACDEQQRLLSAHARAERIDAVRLDLQPRNRAAYELRHAGEVLDLSGIAPGEALEPPALSLRVDDGERAQCRQVAPAVDVLLCRDAASVRRDDERQRRIIAGPVPVRQYDVRRAAVTVVRLVVERHDFHPDLIPGCGGC